jgi:hypothetical protein
MGKTVWILGAGFSKPLGGPLLTELFSPGAELKVKTCFSEVPELQGDDARLARMLYNGKDVPRQWENAEEFLDYLDTAQLGGEAAPSYQALIEMIRGLRSRDNFRAPSLVALSTRELMAAKIKPVAEMSRRLLAAECSAFLVGADVESEKWQPYKRWARQVELGDVVITFNYDLVIEGLAKATEVRPGEKFWVPTAVRQGESSPGRVTVLKLHGSVNWRQDSQPQVPGVVRVSTVPEDDDFALKCEAQKMVIASPGPTKLATADGPLGSLWEAATAALKAAKAIVFVGYRFPPTDSAARRILIDAIGENEGRHLVLHTVLGPNVHSEPAERLKSMLEVAVERQDRAQNRGPTGPGGARTYDLNVHPLWAQDFLDLCDPARLYPHS